MKSLFKPLTVTTVCLVACTSTSCITTVSAQPPNIFGQWWESGKDMYKKVQKSNYDFARQQHFNARQEFAAQSGQGRGGLPGMGGPNSQVHNMPEGGIPGMPGMGGGGPQQQQPGGPGGEDEPAIKPLDTSDFDILDVSTYFGVLKQIGQRSAQSMALHHRSVGFGGMGMDPHQLQQLQQQGMDINKLGHSIRSNPSLMKPQKPGKDPFTWMEEYIFEFSMYDRFCWPCDFFIGAYEINLRWLVDLNTEDKFYYFTVFGNGLAEAGKLAYKGFIKQGLSVVDWYDARSQKEGGRNLVLVFFDNCVQAVGKGYQKVVHDGIVYGVNKWLEQEDKFGIARMQASLTSLAEHLSYNLGFSKLYIHSFSPEAPISLFEAHVVNNANEGVQTLVKFYSPNCPRCQEIAGTFDMLSTYYPTDKQPWIRFAEVDCSRVQSQDFDQMQHICGQLGIRRFPTFYLWTPQSIRKTRNGKRHKTVHNSHIEFDHRGLPLEGFRGFVDHQTKMTCYVGIKVVEQKDNNKSDSNDKSEDQEGNTKTNSTKQKTKLITKSCDEKSKKYARKMFKKEKSYLEKELQRLHDLKWENEKAQTSQQQQQQSNTNSTLTTQKSQNIKTNGKSMPADKQQWVLQRSDIIEQILTPEKYRKDEKAFAIRLVDEDNDDWDEEDDLVSKDEL